MSIKINRLKIRIPAGTSTRPETFARDIANGLAQQTAGAAAHQADHLHLRLRLRPGQGNTSTQITNAVARTLRNRGQI